MIIKNSAKSNILHNIYLFSIFTYFCTFFSSNRNPVLASAQERRGILCNKLKTKCSTSSICGSTYKRLCENSTRSGRMRSKGLKRMKVKVKRQKPKHRRERVKAKPTKNLKTKLRRRRRGRHRRMRKVRAGTRKEGAKPNKNKSKVKRKVRMQKRKRHTKKRANMRANFS